MLLDEIEKAHQDVTNVLLQFMDNGFITGSNGKTICKEWLAALLNSTYNLVKNPKSYNSQIGVPLSVWAIKPNHNLGIFEAGISQPGEMEKLESILKPSHGILTHFGEAHGANFSQEEHKLQEKLMLFKNSKTLIYRSNNWNKIIHTYIKSINPEIELIEWSTEDPTKNIFVHFIRSAHETQIKLKKMIFFGKPKDFIFVVLFLLSCLDCYRFVCIRI